jgi:hypothetical protein
MWMWSYSPRGMVNDVLFWLCVGDKNHYYLDPKFGNGGC